VWPEKNKSDWFLVTCHLLADCHSTLAYTSSFFFFYHLSGITLLLPIVGVLRNFFLSISNMTEQYCSFFFFLFCWLCISIHLCNKNKLDALFILSLFRQSTSTCFGHIHSIPTRPADSQLKSTTHTSCFIYIYIYTVYLLMMGYRYARNV